MRTSAILLAASLVCAATEARADAYSWRGSSGRFDVDVLVSGFNEGAGAGGWSESAAREFATWAVKFNAVIPPGATVTMKRGAEDDDETHLEIHATGFTQETVMEGGPDFDEALAIVSAWSKITPPAAVAPPPLYTVQVFAGSGARARAFADALDARGVDAPDSFYDEACHPCFAHPAHVLEPGADRLTRVVLGVYDHSGAAWRAAAKLRGEHGVLGWVRRL